MVSALIEVVGFYPILPGFESLFHTIYLISQAARFSDEFWRIGNYNR